MVFFLCTFCSIIMPKRTRSTNSRSSSITAQPNRRPRRNSVNSDNFSDALTSVSSTLEQISATMAKLVETNVTVMTNTVNSNLSEVRLNLIPNGDAIPIFDPSVPGQSIVKWLRKVDELREGNKWSDELTSHYALAKLKGIAADWYNGLPSVNHTWSEWKLILVRAFPISENYPKLLRDMLSRMKKPSESYAEYYYSKLRLVSACGIEGKNAVACIIDGLDDDSVANSAVAAALETPDQVYTYLTKLRESRRSQETKCDRYAGEHSKTVNSDGRNKNKTKTCHKCGRVGHYAKFCRSSTTTPASQQIAKPKPLSFASEKKPELKQCSFCHKLGHVEADCFTKKKHTASGSKPTSVNSKIA